MVTLHKPGKLSQWLSIYALYRKAFPRAERKPFGIIVSRYRQGTTDLWCILRDGKFAGFAATVNSPSLILLDYFAVRKDFRQSGIGTSALAQLQQHYAGKGFFVEIEDPHRPGPDQVARQKRQAFYLRCGLEPLQVTAEVFGVPMILLGKGCQLDLEGYQRFYRDHYSPWAAEHIGPPKK